MTLVAHVVYVTIYAAHDVYNKGLCVIKRVSELTSFHKTQQARLLLFQYIVTYLYPPVTRDNLLWRYNLLRRDSNQIQVTM